MSLIATAPATEIARPPLLPNVSPKPTPPASALMRAPSVAVTLMTLEEPVSVTEVAPVTLASIVLRMRLRVPAPAPPPATELPPPPPTVPPPAKLSASMKAERESFRSEPTFWMKIVGPSDRTTQAVPWPGVREPPLTFDTIGVPEIGEARRAETRHEQSCELAVVAGAGVPVGRRFVGAAW